MQTMIVVYIQNPGAEFSPNYAGVGSTSGSAQAFEDLHGMNKIDNGKSSQRDQATAPFWTWFIENPRPNPA